MPRESGRSDIWFWRNTPSAEITSSECISKVQSLFNSPSDISIVRSFLGSEAQTFIDFLDQVLVRSRLDDKLRQRILRLIRRTCQTHGIIPSSYILQEGCIRTEYVRYYGRLGDVSEGQYQGSTVAIKCLKMKDGDHERMFKRLCREIIVWKHLSHPNILPLVGVSISGGPHRFRILTEWTHNGNIVKYTQSNPAANRLQLLSDVMSGVTYLHDLKVVHGDLKGVNILVDDAGVALIADFGLIVMTDLSTFISDTAESSGGTYRWMSPEMLDPKGFDSNGRPTRESDCYALGMVIYEILTGLLPFHRLPGLTFVPAVLRGEHPEKPPHAESLGFSDTLWSLVQACWDKSSPARPTARQLLEHLSLVSPAWVPPTTYPVVMDYTSSTTNSESTDSLKSFSHEVYVRGIATYNWTHVLVVPIVAALLIVCYNFSYLFVL